MDVILYQSDNGGVQIEVQLDRETDSAPGIQDDMILGRVAVSSALGFECT